MLGINELGTGTAESWAAQYKVLLDEVRELQPDTIIFLQAIFHTTQEKSDATFFKNSTIDARNAELQKLAGNETVFYIDCNPSSTTLRRADAGILWRRRPRQGRVLSDVERLSLPVWRGEVTSKKRQSHFFEKSRCAMRGANFTRLIR